MIITIRTISLSIDLLCSLRTLDKTPSITTILPSWICGKVVLLCAHFHDHDELSCFVLLRPPQYPRWRRFYYACRAGSCLFMRRRLLPLIVRAAHVLYYAPRVGEFSEFEIREKGNYACEGST
ncbi:hypothetical protein M758_10G093700 [Ceratodon purpureus]|nr:hypothetical protein M758_10G093700 [Ceratodon purpureus]